MKKYNWKKRRWEDTNSRKSIKAIDKVKIKKDKKETAKKGYLPNNVSNDDSGNNIEVEKLREKKRKELLEKRGKGSRTTIYDQVINKLVITAILLVLQVFLLIEGYNKVEIGNAEKIINEILRILSITLIVISPENPGMKLSWLIIVGIFPIFGSITYIIFGNTKSYEQLKRRVEKGRENISGSKVDDSKIIAKQEGNLKRVVTYLSTYNDFPVYENTEVDYIPLGDDILQSFIKDIRSAKKSIYLEFFIISTGVMWDMLKEELMIKAKEGLDVRIIYDDVGSTTKMPIREIREVKKAGVKVARCNPVLPKLSLIYNSRDHRKIMIIDDTIGYMAGINIGDEYINVYHRAGFWKDVGFRAVGEGVHGMTKIFMEMWTTITDEKENLDEHIPTKSPESEGIVLPFAEVPGDDELVMKTTFMQLIWGAKESIEITTPYLILDNEMSEALIAAAKRGVDVRIVVPGIPDKRLVYEITKSTFYEYVKAGIKIFLYNPGFIHAKMLLFDRKTSIIGSMNQDFRSMYLQFESATLFTSTKVAKEMGRDLDEIYMVSTRVNEKDAKRSIFQKIRQGFLRILAPLF